MRRPAAHKPGFVADYRKLFAGPWARFILARGVPRGHDLLRRLHLRRRRPAHALRPELLARRPRRRRLRRRQRALRGDRAARWCRGCARPAWSISGGIVAMLGYARRWPARRVWEIAPVRRRRARPRLLHAAQHAADPCHADAAGGARHRASPAFPRRCSSARAPASRSPRRSSTAPARRGVCDRGGAVAAAGGRGSRGGSRRATRADRLRPAARDALDLGAHDALDQARQVVVEPGLQHRPQHFLDQILERARVVAPAWSGRAC